MKGEGDELREGCFEKSAYPYSAMVRTPDPSPEVGPDKENPRPKPLPGKTMPIRGSDENGRRVTKGHETPPKVDLHDPPQKPYQSKARAKTAAE